MVKSRGITCDRSELFLDLESSCPRLWRCYPSAMRPDPLPAVAFQVLHNGRPLCIAGLRGKPGVITTILDCVDRPHRRRLSLQVGGLESGTDAHILWAHRELAIGDEVIVRIVENAKPTRVRQRVRISTSKQSREQQERNYLRR